MGSILRYLAVRPEPQVAAVLGPNTSHLCWMYEHYALPYRDAGFTKLNVIFTTSTEAGAQPPLADPFGWTAEVRAAFDVDAFAALSEHGQRTYYVEQLHGALLRCARHFGWALPPLDRAGDRLLADGLRFAFWWKRPLSSPDRRTRVQGFVEAAAVARLWLVFSDRRGAELHRGLLAVTPCGSGIPPSVFGKVQWVDNATVRVVHRNGRDYWLCGVNDQPQFHYPRAEQGDAHGEYDLGRMYYEGGLLPPDPERGLLLIRAAASKGNEHAARFLARLERESISQGHDGEPAGQSGAGQVTVAGT